MFACEWKWPSKEKKMIMQGKIEKLQKKKNIFEMAQENGFRAPWRCSPWIRARTPFPLELRVG